MPLLILILVLLLLAPAGAQPYQTPDPVLARIVDQPLLPSASVSPDYRWVGFFRRQGHQTIAELSGPELKLAGIRFNPEKYGPSRDTGYDQLTMKDRNNGRSWVVQGVPGRILERGWSPDSSTLVLLVEESDGLKLWAVAAGGKEARRISQRRINLVLGPAFRWGNDGATLLTTLVVEGEVPPQNAVPTGPAIQETSGSKAPVRTYQDLLKDHHDADLFAYYATSQLVRLSLDGKVTPLSEPAVTYSYEASPDGRYILQWVLDRPFSFLVPASRFAGRYLLRDADGTLLKTVEKFAASEELPKGFDSVRTGRRSMDWRSDAPATLVWAEAADQGNMKTETEVHDRIYTWAAPFQDEPVNLLDLELRYSGMNWGHENLALVSEWRFSDRKLRTWKFNPAQPQQPRVVFEDRSYNDRYKDPGSPLYVRGRYGTHVMATLDDGKTLLLRGNGASPEGKIPFLDHWNSSTGKSQRVWQSEAPYYERVLALLEPGGTKVLSLRESVDTPPNFFERDLASGEVLALTEVPHPTPEFKNIKKEILHYKRADGVELSGTLYLPGDYQGGPLPVLMWAYPHEFKDAAVAGQKNDSPYEFNRVSYWGPLPFLAQGYAVFDDPKMPIVGEGDKLPNDAFREQLVANAQAAVDVLVKKGVCDPERVAIGGHSYGAFMVANLLAHSDLFKTGIARSGAYNRSLTPFGFQGEERDFWEAQSVYASMSPFFHAEKINEPILMIHGEEDNNSGTYPMQSERMYAALKGLGGRARLVMLPKESHGYRARESLLHMLWEEQEWLKKHLK